MTLGEKLTALRIRKRLTQEEIVEVLNKRYNLQLKRAQYSKWETDENPVSVDLVKVFCRYYHITADSLIFDEKKIEGISKVKTTIARVDLVDY